MTSSSSGPTVTLTEQMLRRRPVIGAPVAHGAADHLKRTIGTFQLTMFGVGATIGTGIFFVLSHGGARGGPGGHRLVRHGGHRGGPRGDLLRRDGLVAFRYRAAPTPTPTRPSARSSRWAWPPACCWSTAYRPRRSRSAGAATSTKRSTTSSGSSCRTAILAAPWDADPGIVNLPAVVLVVLCTLLLIRGASESARSTRSWS